MVKALDEGLARLENTTVVVHSDDTPDTDGQASTIVRFSDGSVLRAAYWRVLQNGKTRLSSFDHHQKYGLPAPINAIEQLASLLNGSTCSEVKCDSETADLIFSFAEGTKLQVFNFTGYEVWDIHFPDGTGEYSNYALAKLFAPR